MSKKQPAKYKLGVLFDKLYGKSPNVYAFLVEQGVDTRIAEEAQELISNVHTEVYSSIADRFESKIEELEDEFDHEVEKFRKRIAILNDDRRF